MTPFGDLVLVSWCHGVCLCSYHRWYLECEFLSWFPVAAGPFSLEHFVMLMRCCPMELQHGPVFSLRF